MNKKKILSGILCLSLLTFSSCSLFDSSPTPVSNFYGQDDLGDIKEEEEAQNFDDIQIRYSSFTSSKTPTNVTLTSSWVADHELSTAQITTIADILYGIDRYDEYINLTTNITEEQFNSLMIILLTNYPEAFNIDITYKYTLGINGYVQRLYPTYLYEDAEYQNLKAKFQDDLLRFANGNKDTPENEIISRLDIPRCSYTEITPISMQIGKQETSSTGGLSSLGAAKYAKYYLDYIGIESIVVLGEFIDVEDPLYNLYTHNDIKIKGDSEKTATLNLSNYHAWNLVNLNGTWVNCDFYLNGYYSSQNSVYNGILINCTDEIIRQTRIFMPTYNLIGSTPPCTSYMYNPFYRSNCFVKDYTDENVIKCIDLWLETAADEKGNHYAFNFETEANYRTFVKNIRDRLALYNQTHNNLFGNNIQINSNDNLLVVNITNITYKNV